MKRNFLVALALLCFTGSLAAQDGLDGIFTAGNPEAQDKSGLEVSGKAGFEVRYFFDSEATSQVLPVFSADLSLMIKEQQAEASVMFAATEDFQGTPLTADDLLETAYIRGYLPFGYLEAGLMKSEWGKGDGIHAVDPLNPLDQTKGIKPDLNDMKIAVPMIRLLWTIAGNASMELVYEPFFTPAKIAATGRWALADYSLLPPVQPAPDTQTLEYSSGGARIKGSFGSFDLGGIWYYGYISQPGLAVTTVTNIVYTKAQLFGLEAAFVAGPLTFMAEGGYWLSEDTDGTTASLYNSKAVYLAGADFTIPGTEAFLSLQLNGSYVMNYESLTPLDADAMASINNQPWSNTIIAAIDWPFANETIKIRIAGLYSVEAQGYLILPQATWKMTDNLELTVKGQIYGGADISGSLYHAWDRNDNAGLEMKYIF